MKMARSICLLYWLASVTFVGADDGAVDEDWDFTPPAPRPFEVGGYLEFKGEYLRLDREAAFYPLTYSTDEQRGELRRGSALLELKAEYKLGAVRFHATGQSSVSWDDLDSAEETRLLTGYASYSPGPTFAIDVGKRVLRWGTGYAWNPVAFLERLKDPLDPGLSREGFVMVSAGWTRSFAGDTLQSVGLHPVVVPSNDDINRDFGERNRVNPALRLSALVRDTDVDLLALSEGSRAGKAGMALARNVTSNFEIHAEWARVFNDARPLLDADGRAVEEVQDANRFLAGLRYLTHRETTVILEYYRDETGYSRDEFERYIDFTRDAVEKHDAGGDDADVRRARSLRRDAYGAQNPMRNYLYARVSHPEPFDILYFTPALFTIVNLDDASFQVVPEMRYTGYRELELRLRAAFLSGSSQSEFGVRPTDQRVELRVRHYF